MIVMTIVCARCAGMNHAAERSCTACGLSLGKASPDAVAGLDAIEPHETPEPADPDVARMVDAFARSSGYEASPTQRGWRLVVPLGLGRRQAVYLGPAGTDSEGRSIISLVSVCGTVDERDCRAVLKLNGRIVEGRFAVRVLRGEEYFVVIENVDVGSLSRLSAHDLARRVAQAADGLEDRLSRGADVY